jgi:hypothetical protein
MKRFLAKVGRFFWSWGFLKFILWCVTLIVFFYVEEDWRGAGAWAVTKAEWEAKGESLDYSKFIPPPIPDDQNLAAIPLFKLEPAKYDNGISYLRDGALQRAMRTDLPGNDLPPTGNWTSGKLPDMEKIRHVIATDYAVAFKGVSPPQGTLDQFNALYPFLTDLRAAAATRPLCRFDLDYTASPPATRPMALLVDQLRLSRILMFHAILALDHRQSDLALEDIKISYKLLSGAKRDPTLLGGLVAIGMAAVSDAVLYDGLALHAWSDDQLVELEHTLEPINFLADYQFAIRSEAVLSADNLDFFKNVPHGGIIKLITGMSDNIPSPSNTSDLLGRILFSWPSGWWDNNKSRMANALLGAVALSDPKAHRVFVDRADQWEKEARRFKSHWTAAAPWNIFYAIAAPPILNALIQFTHGQSWIDQARVACRLERYRLIHGVYPDSLEVLVPSSIDTLPCDPINGQAYHYHIRPDGTFLLYSVGWNQKDDGGDAVFVLINSTDPNDSPQKHGDWVWPTPK